jgi:hypothetical protein
MKKYLFPLIVLIILAVSVSPVFAAGGPPAGKGKKIAKAPFTLSGTITAINGSTVTVKVAAGNKLVKTLIGKELSVQTTSSTIYLKTDGTTTVKITFGDLAVGQKISMSGTVTNTVYTATRITVGAKLVHLP